MECFDAAGIDLDPNHTQPFTNAERARQAGILIAESEAQPGDLVYFHSTYDTPGASHVGIVADPVACVMYDDHDRGDGTGPGETSYLSGYWRDHLLDFRRVERPFESAPQPALFWTADEVAQAAGVSGANGKNVETYWPFIAQAMTAWGIATPLVGIGIIGTIAKESSSFAPVHEAFWLSDAARWAYYQDTRQHAAYGGGPNYHGRGFVQLTHQSNYQAAQDAINEHMGWDLDLVGNPDLALDGEVAAHIICWFFVAKGLVPLCEQQNWAEVRRRVWGAYGDADGVGKLQRAANVLVPLAQARGFA